MLDIHYERSLVGKCKSGNQQAFEELEEDCREKVRRSIFGLVKDEHSAEDIYQQGLFKSWKKIKKFKGESRFSTWLCRICFNLAYDKFRKESRNPTVFLEEFKAEGLYKEDPLEKGKSSEDGGYRKITIAELGQRLEKTLGHISPEHREVLELFAKEDLSYEEIAKKINAPVGTVMSRLFYAKKKAKKRYKVLLRNEK